MPDGGQAAGSEQHAGAGHDQRATLLCDAESRTFDLIVIGGGINGAGIARDAALRGLAVLLLEQHDYGFGTTWRSTKLIHGGLRYLEHREFRLVFEGLRERGILLRTAPHLVAPLQLLLPILRGGHYGPRIIRAGMLMYDALALGRGMPRHRSLSPAGAAALEPALDGEALRGGFAYYDAQVALPERLCLENVLSAQAAGAAAFNHVAVTGLCAAAGRICGVRARDGESGRELEFRGQMVVNAAGPWVDAVLRDTGIGQQYLGGTKGSHIVVDYAGAGPRHAIYAEARDGRPFFIIPWRGRHLIGTTDVPFAGDPAAVLPDAQEIAYLRGEAQRVLPGAPIADSAILYAYSGVRPLPRARGVRAGAITRRHFIHAHDDSGYAGLLSVVGGKLTSYRSLAAEVVGSVCRRLGRPAGHSATDTLPLVPGPVPPAAGALAEHLTSIYGARAAAVQALAQRDPALARPLCAHGADIAAQAVHAVRREGARTVGDVLLRRTPAGWNACRGLDAAPTVAHLLAAELGRDAEWESCALAAYRQEVDKTLVPGDGAVAPA